MGTRLIVFMSRLTSSSAEVSRCECKRKTVAPPRGATRAHRLLGNHRTRAPTENLPRSYQIGTPVTARRDRAAELSRASVATAAPTTPLAKERASSNVAGLGSIAEELPAADRDDHRYLWKQAASKRIV
ncbi:hypothetical protein MRX96_038236 [Rhipicephalus microplus]